MIADIRIVNFKFELKRSIKVASLGISSFITQMTFVCVMTVQNNLFSKYGAISKFGAEIPITVFGIVMKTSQILNSIIIGIAAGSQPILGYNYGAEKFDRVKKTLKTVLGLGVVVSTFAFILFQTIPDKLINIFGSADGETAEIYIEFACLAFRRYLLLCICNGIQIPSGIFFQSIGKSTKSAILSLSRQIIFLIPAFFILGASFGIMGLLYAGPVADGLAFIISVTLLIIEVKHLKKSSINSQSLIDDTSTDNKLNKNIIITISREYGSGGRYVGRLIADILGIKFYDKDFVKNVTKGDIIVANKNFGCGSSREHAPIAIKASGISCVIAATFARIFYRNSINTALPILECREAAERIDNGDDVEINFDTGEIKNVTKNEVYHAEPFPDFIKEIIDAGGLMNSIKEKK